MNISFFLSFSVSKQNKTCLFLYTNNLYMKKKFDQ